MTADEDSAIAWDWRPVNGRRVAGRCRRRAAHRMRDDGRRCWPARSACKVIRLDRSGAITLGIADRT
jgi:hypothetical protein